MISFIYTTLHISLFIILIFYSLHLSTVKIGNRNGKFVIRLQNKRLWKLAIVPILAFTLEEGLRWARETDWIFYYGVYKDFLAGDSTDHELLFQLSWKGCAMLGLNYPTVICLCSFLFATAVFFFYRPFIGSKAIIILIPLCFANHLITASNLIRWYMAMSILLIGLRLFLDKKKKIGMVIMACAPFFHLFTIALFPFIWICNKTNCLLKPLPACLLCTILLFTFNPSFLSHFTYIFDLFTLFDRFSGYADHGYAFILGKDGGLAEKKNILSLFITYIPYYIFIVLGYKLKIPKSAKLTKDSKNVRAVKDRDKRVKKNRVSLLYKNRIPSFTYNMLFVGAIFKACSNGLELLGRMYYFFDFFVLIVCSICCVRLYFSKHNLVNTIMLLFCAMFIVSKLWHACQPLQYDELMLYVWNDNYDPWSIMEFKRKLFD